MRTIQSSFFGPEMQALLKTVNDEPISIESGGKPVVIMVSPKAYGDLLNGRSGQVRRYRRLTTDANELFGLPGDMFGNDV